jgi:hypothetical protein
VHKTSQGSECEKIRRNRYVYIPSDVYRTVERNNNISTDQSEMRDANQKSFLSIDIALM